jgi:hypothetical protein
MQKLSALKNWFSLIQFLRSTTSECMMEICPAGPPKLINPSFVQNFRASLNDMISDFILLCILTVNLVSRIKYIPPFVPFIFFHGFLLV